jgi:hypothetical protein
MTDGLLFGRLSLSSRHCLFLCLLVEGESGIAPRGMGLDVPSGLPFHEAVDPLLPTLQLLPLRFAPHCLHCLSGSFRPKGGNLSLESQLRLPIP